MIGLGFVFLLLGTYAIYLQLSLENTKVKLESEKQDNENLKKALEDTVAIFSQNLEIEKDKNSIQIEVLKEKEKVIKVSERVRVELEKRKVMKQNETDENNCPKFGTLSL
ncbi:hypothetical protein ACNSOO_04765 [Aliarcobacter lanthieri]|uniref:hypothetical protein n=1 Tax=Aliarcobacter lanthieri TaxID=1355374 RepID=UPI003AAD520E